MLNRFFSKKSRVEDEGMRGSPPVDLQVIDSLVMPNVSAGSTSVDPWIALQERKLRKRTDGERPTVESKFAKLAKLAASQDQ